MGNTSELGYIKQDLKPDFRQPSNGIAGVNNLMKLNEKSQNENTETGSSKKKKKKKKKKSGNTENTETQSDGKTFLTTGSSIISNGQQKSVNGKIFGSQQTINKFEDIQRNTGDFP